MALLAVLAVSSASASAQAYCRKTTIEPPDGWSPTAGEPCWPNGLPLFWRPRCVGFDVQEAASRVVSYEQATAVLERAFGRWTESECPGHPSIAVSDLGPVQCTSIGYSKTSSNQNLVVFRDSVWTGKNPTTGEPDANQLALTTLTFDTRTGEIYDADIEVNATIGSALTVGEPAADGFDLETILTHEAGHFLGLGHSVAPDATMRANYHRRALALADDDVAGICAVYTPEGPRSVGTAYVKAGSVAAGACDPTPRRGLTRACAVEVEPGCACTTTAQPRSRGGSGPLAPFAGAALLAASALRRRSRSSGPAPDRLSQRLLGKVVPP